MGSHAFYRDNLATIIPKKALKYKECMAISFQLLARLSLKKCWLAPIFVLDSDSPC